MAEFYNLTLENIDTEHLCCIIRSKTKHPGVEAKRTWLKERIKEGHIFRKLNAKGCCFIEYAPLETAWTPVSGDNYMYIYCLWVDGELKKHGYGKELMEYAIQDAKEKGKSGLCMLASKKQKNWLSSKDFASKYGFTVVDSTDNDYQLLALSFDGTVPQINDCAKVEKIEEKELTIYYSDQCPFIQSRIEITQQFCTENGINSHLYKVDTLHQAKELPCVFNNFAIFYHGEFKDVNLINLPTLEKMFKKG